MGIQVFVVSTVEVDGRFQPATPSIFTSPDDADAFLVSVMREFWAGLGLDRAIGEMPEPWEKAQEMLASEHTDGSWCWYALTPHVIG